MFTPMTSFPDDLMASGTVFAIASTFSAGADAVGDPSPLLDSVLFVQPERARAPVAANTAAMRQILVRRS